VTSVSYVDNAVQNCSRSGQLGR